MLTARRQSLVRRPFITSVVAAALLSAACGRVLGLGELQGASDDSARSSAGQGGASDWIGAAGVTNTGPTTVGEGGEAMRAPATRGASGEGSLGNSTTSAGVGAGGASGMGEGGFAGTLPVPPSDPVGGTCHTQWITRPGVTDVPDGAVDAAQGSGPEASASSSHRYVCRVMRGNAVFLGEWLEGQFCYFSDGSSAQSSSDYDLLTTSGCTDWYPPPATGPMLPALVGGHFQADPLYVCRADDGTGALHPGYLGAPTDFKCRIASAQDVSSFELLVPGVNSPGAR